MARTLLHFLGPVILLYVLFTTDLGALWRVLLGTHLGLFGLSCLLVVPFLFLKGWRWLLILRAWKMPLPLGEATALYSIGIFLGVVTPGQAGDAVKAWYLRQRGYPLTAGLASVVVDRLFDLLIMGVLAASGLYFFSSVLPGRQVVNAVVVAFVLGGVVFGLLLAGSARIRSLVSVRVLPLLPLSIRERLKGTAGLHLSGSQIGLVGLVTALGLGLTFVRTYLLFLALGTPVPIGPFVALVALISIVAIVSPGGVGTRDAALILGLAAILHRSPREVSPVALSLSALLLLLSLLNVVVGFCFSLRYPINEAIAPRGT